MPAADPTALVASVLSGPALAAAVVAAWDAGEAILPLNPAAPLAERERLLARHRPTHLVDRNGRRDLADGLGVDPDVVAVVVTSGTSGPPKGVELTRAGMEVMGRGYTAGLDASPSDRWLACLPLHHVASLGVLARSYVTGIPFVVHDGFDIGRVASSPRAEGSTMVSVVPTTLLRLLDAGAPMHEYRRVVVGGAPCALALRARAEAAGVHVVDAYGLSETWGGFALDGIPIAGADMTLGRDGEVLVRGAMVMRGYRLDPDATAAAFEDDEDDWLRTGDVGQIVDGRLQVVDRIKDLVITGGVNVSPTTVESVLARHASVADVCVIGTPDEEWGERVVAHVVPRDPADPPTLDELRAFARDELAPAQLPRELRLVDSVPRTTSGKPLRRELRDRA